MQSSEVKFRCCGNILRSTWHNLQWSGSRWTLAQADPCTNPNYLSSKRVWPRSDFTAADQTHCCWNIALAVGATSWQRCAFTGGKHNHNKHSWTWVFTFQRGDASCSVWMKPAGGRGLRGVAWQPRLAVVPRHCGSSSIRALNISLGLWRCRGSCQLRWWAAGLKSIKPRQIPLPALTEEIIRFKTNCNV